MERKKRVAMKIAAKPKEVFFFIAVAGRD